MGLWRGAAGSDRDLGSRLRAESQRVQDGRWKLEGMSDCLAMRPKTGMRVENRVQIVVQICQRMADGKGGQDTEGEG